MPAGTVSIVYFDADHSSALAADVADVFGEHGFTTRTVAAQHSRSDLSDFALVVLLAMPVHSFLAALGETLGAAAGNAIRDFFDQILARVRKRDSRPTTLIVRDTRGIDIELRHDLPIKALEQLTDVIGDETARLRYDADTETWVITNR